MSLLNKSQVRKFALDKASEQRKMWNGKPRFTRVSPAVYDVLETRIKSWIMHEVNSAPSKGRTLFKHYDI